MSVNGRVLFTMDLLIFFGFKRLNDSYCHYEAWKSQAFFYYLTDCIRLKEESHKHTYDGLRVSKTWANYNFGVNYPFIAAGYITISNVYRMY